MVCLNDYASNDHTTADCHWYCRKLYNEEGIKCYDSARNYCLLADKPVLEANNKYWSGRRSKLRKKIAEMHKFKDDAERLMESYNSLDNERDFYNFYANLWLLIHNWYPIFYKDEIDQYYKELENEEN